MKKKKIELSRKLTLSKEAILNLNEKTATGGKLLPSGRCHSVAWACGSFDTNCYSACQGGCDFTFPDCSGSIIGSVQCSQMC